MQTPAGCRDLASFISERTFETPEQQGLLADIRAGKFIASKSIDPKQALLVALDHIDAPDSVKDHVRQLQFEEPRPPISDAVMASLAAFVGDTNYSPNTAEFDVPEDFDATSWYTEQLMPDGSFVDSVKIEGEIRMQRAVDKEDFDRPPDLEGVVLEKVVSESPTLSDADQ